MMFQTSSEDIYRRIRTTPITQCICQIRKEFMREEATTYFGITINKVFIDCGDGRCGKLGYE